MFAWSLVLVLVLPGRLYAAPVHDIEASFALAGGKAELGAAYEISGLSGQAVSLSANFIPAVAASIKYFSGSSGSSAFFGRGNPANSIALRHCPTGGRIAGAPIPWTLSRSESDDQALGFRMGAVDSLIVFTMKSSGEFSFTNLIGDVSALAVQVFSQGKALGGGFAFSLTNLARQEYGDGWTEGPLPSPGGLFANLAFSCKLGGPHAHIEFWGSACAGLLEPLGAAFSLRGEWESPWNPRYGLEVFSFLSFPGYRAWTGDSPEWDMAVSAILRAAWDKMSAKIEGRLFSQTEAVNRIDWMPGKAEADLNLEGFGYSLSCEAAFSASNPFAASVGLSREFEIKAIPRGRIGLNLSADTGDADIYSAGFSLGWKLNATTTSAGKVSMNISIEPESEGLSYSLAGAARQEFPLNGLGSISLSIQSPEGGYRIGKTKPGLPDLALYLSLRFP